MGEKALHFENLGFGYQPGAWVLRGLTGEVGRGETLAILGPNGRGKTTLLRLLLGALRPQEGRVETHGRTAFVPQLFQVAFDYSALDMVLMGRARRLGWLGEPGREDERLGLETLDRFGLADLARQPFGQLSGGQRQLVILARALMAEAEILVLDEPLSALDLKNQEIVLSRMARLRSEGLTVVFTTHQPAHAQAVATSALLLLAVTSAIIGPVDEVLTEERLRALYGVRLRRIILDEAGGERTAFVPAFELRAE